MIYQEIDGITFKMGKQFDFGFLKKYGRVFKVFDSSVKQKSLVKYINSEKIGGGFAMIFEWADGECMGRMYERSHDMIMKLPLDEKLHIFECVIDFLIDIAAAGYVAVDLYDGSVMYDTVRKTVTICDIDFFRKSPSVNDMGRIWGSSRFMSPKEYGFGERIDEITNVFYDWGNGLCYSERQ